MNLENQKCPICNAGIIEKHTGYTFEYKGKKINFPNFVSYICPTCGEEIEVGSDNLDLDDEITLFMRQVDNLLTPKEIRNIRQSYGLTQKEFARRLGVGEKTFTRYETGKVTQSRTTDHLLKLLRDDPQNLDRIISYSEIDTLPYKELTGHTITRIPVASPPRTTYTYNKTPQYSKFSAKCVGE